MNCVSAAILVDIAILVIWLRDDPIKLVGLAMALGIISILYVLTRKANSPAKNL
jgi:hypothetical protein